MASQLDLVEDWPAQAAASGYRVQQIAVEFGVSEQTVRRFFRTHFGKNPKQCFAAWLAQDIKRRLKQGAKVGEIAAAFQMLPSNLKHVIRRGSPAPCTRRQISP